MREQTSVPVPMGLCRRCVRRLSHYVSDLPGVVSLEVEAARGRLSVTGKVDRAALLSARDRASCRL
ncbi:cation transporter [Actinoplanes sp. URMC 104]|uniref:cation transporter n=1 Tax=Actinoplanes sp. URMC 104 TaxID=3423409 RepID=UPI003F19C0C7